MNIGNQYNRTKINKKNHFSRDSHCFHKIISTLFLTWLTKSSISDWRKRQMTTLIAEKKRHEYGGQKA